MQLTFCSCSLLLRDKHRNSDEACPDLTSEPVESPDVPVLLQISPFAYSNCEQWPTGSIALFMLHAPQLEELS